MLKIWGHRSSSNVQALMWCVGELDLPFDRIDAGFIYGGVDTPGYLAMNPNGTVPTLQDGTNPPMWETGAILRYPRVPMRPKNFGLPIQLPEPKWTNGRNGRNCTSR